ncbi:MAG: thiolase family protein [Proteobacteria bacterium]|nr:thiolase family protein [Pseudomonadota bacterium]
MARNPLHDVCIAGVYNTQQARVLEGVNEVELLVDAMRGTLADAGVAPHEVDGVNVRSAVWRINAREVSHWLGCSPKWNGGEFGIAGVLEAAGAIATSQASVVLMADAQCGQYTERALTAPWTRPTNEFVECWGLYTAAEFALIAQRHMAVYGTRPEALAEVSAAIRSNGAINPDAVYYGRPCTPEDVLASRMVADPFHLLDCCMTSEGGAGLLLTTVERALDLDCEPIYILGGGLDRFGMSYVMAPVYDKYGLAGRRAAQDAFEQGGIGPQDVDVCEFYDPFSFELIRQFEAFGFCDEGEGGDFVMDGRVRIDGDFPLCTNGGLMAYSHAGTAQLLQKTISAVLQLRGKYIPELTVPNAKIAMATNGGAGALFTDLMIVGKEQP